MKVLLCILFAYAVASRVHVGSSSPHMANDFLKSQKFVSKEKLFDLKLLLHAEDETKLFEAFVEVSDPSSRRFAQYLTPAGVCELTKPAAKTVKKVEHFLKKHNIRITERNLCNDEWSIQGSHRDIAAAFHARIAFFTSRKMKDVEILASEKPLSVPKSLEQHIRLVHGLHFPVVYSKKEKKEPAVQRGDTSYADATPQNLKALYGVNDLVASANSSASQAFAGWEHQSFSPGDLEDFQNHYGLQKTEIKMLAGSATNTGFPHMEANLDSQTITALGEGVPTFAFLNPGFFSFDVLDWIMKVDKEANPPLVWSVSYGEDLSSKTATYSQSTNSYFQKLALRGVSILIASGDTGAEARTSAGKIAAEFPAVLPACTAVGATVLAKNLTETSCVSCDFGWCSGGGFSIESYFPNTTCPWTNEAQNHYLATASGLPEQSKWSSMVGGCGFPDTSAVGTNHMIYYYRIRQGVAGTSSSCPTMSGMVSLLNDQRMQKGKKSLGFLNQIIYKNPQLFNDITQGNTGWPASAGWDATTGMGSPKFQELLTYVLSLP